MWEEAIGTRCFDGLSWYGEEWEKSETCRDSCLKTSELKKSHDSKNLSFAYYQVFWGLIMTQAVRLLKDGVRDISTYLSLMVAADPCETLARASRLFRVSLQGRVRNNTMPYSPLPACHTLSGLIFIWNFSVLACFHSKLREGEGSANFSAFLLNPKCISEERSRKQGVKTRKTAPWVQQQLTHLSRWHLAGEPITQQRTFS